MDCLRCKNTMKLVSACGDTFGIPIYLKYKKKGILELEKTSQVDAYVCTKCGYVELKAVAPDVFLDVE